jgi:cyclohexadieny/prephenate dehydrogenase
VTRPFPPFERLAVLGLGLLGGSVALAARRAGAALAIVGSARRRGPLERALAAGVVDEIVLASPVGAMPDLLKEAAPALRPGAIVTDVGSVKASLAGALPALLPAGVHYVGSHPMAGSHLRGVEHARAELFQDATCAVASPPGADAGAVERVAGFWSALGARVVRRDPERHDAEVAWTSHVPHALAFAFAEALAGAPEGAGVLAGPGFRDFTRIARSDAELWGDILCANRRALVAPLEAVGQSLERLARAVEQGDVEAVERFLSTARERLAAVEGARPRASGTDRHTSKEQGTKKA